MIVLLNTERTESCLRLMLAATLATIILPWHPFVSLQLKLLFLKPYFADSTLPQLPVTSHKETSPQNSKDNNKISFGSGTWMKLSQTATCKDTFFPRWPIATRRNVLSHSTQTTPLNTNTQVPWLQVPCPEHIQGQPSPRYTLSKAQTLPRSVTVSCSQRNLVAGELAVGGGSG